MDGRHTAAIGRCQRYEYFNQGGYFFLSIFYHTPGYSITLSCEAPVLNTVLRACALTIMHMKCPAAAPCEVQRITSLAEERFKLIVE